MNIEMKEFVGYILDHKPSKRMVMNNFELSYYEYMDYMNLIKEKDLKLYRNLIKTVKMNGYKELRCYRVAKYIVENKCETLQIINNFNITHTQIINDIKELREMDELLSDQAGLIMEHNDNNGIPKSIRQHIKQQKIKNQVEKPIKKEKAEARYITIAKYIIDKKCSFNDVCNEFNINMEQVNASLCNLKTKQRILYDNVMNSARFD
jgi:hypothetical protein